MVSDQPFAAFKVAVFPSLKVIMISLGLTPSWLLASSHTFLIVVSVSAVLWVFVIVVIVPSVSLLVNSYPSGTTVSFQVYLINWPFSYFGKLLIVAVHLLPSSNVTIWPLLRLITISSGLIPSWFSASFHTFITVASISSGLWVFVIVVIVPSLVFPVTSYPSGMLVSVQV